MFCTQVAVDRKRMTQTGFYAEKMPCDTDVSDEKATSITFVDAVSYAGQEPRGERLSLAKHPRVKFVFSGFMTMLFLLATVTAVFFCLAHHQHMGIANGMGGNWLSIFVPCTIFAGYIS